MHAYVSVVCVYVFVHVCRMDDNRQPKRLLFGDRWSLDIIMVQSSIGEMWWMLIWSHSIYHWMTGMIWLQVCTSSIPEAFHKLLIVIQVYSVLLEFLIVCVAALSIVKEI